MILIVSPSDDIHALSVCRALKETIPDIDVAIFDSASFPLKASIEIRTSTWQLIDNTGSRLSSDDITAVWWRRAASHQISDRVYDPAARRFIVNECSQVFNSIAAWPTYLTLNNVERERVASLKPVQLAVASQIGLIVPETLITNDPESANEFCSIDQSVVFKTLSSPVSTFGETRRYKREHKGKLSSLSDAPVIFQREIAKRRDIRVTAVGDEIFSAAIAHNNPVAMNYPDWRLDAAAECIEYKLPDAICAQVRALMSRLGLLYGAIDFIETCTGDLVFLEINPCGQFLFVEIDTGQPISKAIASLLSNAR